MESIRIVEAEQEHIDKMLGKLRNADDRECRASVDLSADEALQCSFTCSDKCWVVLNNNKPIAAFGVRGVSALSNEGVVWMLATEGLARAKDKQLLVKKSIEYVKIMQEPFETIENYIDIRNKLSIKWLKWCGFKCEKPIHYGTNDELFMRFYRRKDTCAE